MGKTVLHQEDGGLSFWLGCQVDILVAKERLINNMLDATFKVAVPIRFAHCDPAGIVFYPRYFEMINSVVEDWLAEALGWPFSTIVCERKEGLPTVNIDCQFMSPSRLGDVVEFELIVLKLGKSSFTVVISGKNKGVEVLKATHVLVYTSREKGETSLEIPQALREKMLAFCHPQ